MTLDISSKKPIHICCGSVNNVFIRQPLSQKSRTSEPKPSRCLYRLYGGEREPNSPQMWTGKLGTLGKMETIGPFLHLASKRRLLPRMTNFFFRECGGGEIFFPLRFHLHHYGGTTCTKYTVIAGVKK
jgi:hypothetical protein